MNFTRFFLRLPGNEIEYGLINVGFTIQGNKRLRVGGLERKG